MVIASVEVAERYDALVIGGGMSGLEAACELAQAGLSVLVVDAAMSGAAETGAATGVRWSTTCPPHYVDAGLPPVLGGRSRRWHGVVMRMEGWALHDPTWPPSVAAALVGGPPGHEGLYTEMERDLAEWTGSPLDAPANEDEVAVVAAAAEWAGVAARVVPRAVRRGGTAPLLGVGAYSPLDRWHSGVTRADRRGRAEICPGAVAVEVLSRREHVAGARLADVITGDVTDVAAGVVVAAAGTIENTRLIAQTGMGPVLGGLHDHLVQGFVVQVPAGALGLRDDGEGFAVAAGGPAVRSNLFVRVRPAGRATGELLLDVWAMGEQSGAGEIHFDVTATPPWPTTVVPVLAAVDEGVLEAQRRWLDEVWAVIAASAGLSPQPLKLGDPWQAPIPFSQAVAQVGERSGPVGYSWPLGTVDHEGGTLGLGRRLHPDGGVPGLNGLYVVGPTVFPRPGAANPSLTTLALARRTARVVLGTAR